MKVNYEKLIAKAREEIQDMKRIIQTCEPCMRDDYPEIWAAAGEQND